ncbi:hypothetical protein [Sphingosinicella terrae]|uniref:hypothetical protein n=1 Tax=Sphingosinicella terrae TaxID=2172047 RepID=UPI000E0CF17C|nr:hypothetical protein [Sphingosinicella terrae]
MRRLLPIAASLAALLALLATFLFLRSGPAGWERSVTRNPQNDGVAHDFRLRSLDGDALLALRCTPHAPIEAVVTADDPLGPDGDPPRTRRARLALDGEPASEREVGVAVGAIGLTQGDPEQARAFVIRLGSSHRLDVALDAAADGGGFVASFATVGADDVVAELRQYCL